MPPGAWHPEPAIRVGIRLQRGTDPRQPAPSWRHRGKGSPGEEVLIPETHTGAERGLQKWLVPFPSSRDARPSTVLQPQATPWVRLALDLNIYEPQFSNLQQTHKKPPF